MIRKSQCTLVFERAYTKENKSPSVDYRRVACACDDCGTFSSGFYLERDRRMGASVTLRIARHRIKASEGETLRTVEYNDCSYEVKEQLTDNKRGGRGHRFILLDCQEVKR